MSRDPRWVRIASRAYAACLWLYPPAIRAAHGAEMQQAFRDRCREVAAGRRTAWHLGLELAPDLVASSARAHLEGGFGRLPAIALLLFASLAAALATQPRWSAVANDGIKAVESAWMMWREQREFSYRDGVVGGLADRYAAAGDPVSLAIAARLRDSLSEQERLYYGPALGEAWSGEARPHTLHMTEQRDRAARLAGETVTASGSARALAIAVPACRIAGGCNIELALRRLLEREPDNALGWMLEFKRAAQRGDEARMRAAIEGAGRARYLESYMGVAKSAIFAAASEASRDDDAAIVLSQRATALESLPSDDFTHDLRYHCSLAVGARPNDARWLTRHPEARPACLHLAGLLAASSDLQWAAWGWRQLQRAGGVDSPSTQAAYRNILWLQQRSWDAGRHVGADYRHWTPWTAGEWADWRAAWQPGDGEDEAVRRWLRARGLPVRAPADFVPRA